jgi:ATP-dependent exoDNAse (exonuclease V) alpha subunit
MERLVRLANLVEVARLVQVGDTRQLGAVDAGKPFERSQLAGHATAHLNENLRSRSDQMKAVTAALDRGDVGRAFDVLRPSIIEVARTQVPVTAARMWAVLPKAERGATLLLASGRAMRAAANAAAQSELKAAGEIGGPSVTLSVLDRVTVTREGARQERAYEAGRVVEFRTDLSSQQLARGTRGTVVGVERGQVVLRMADGSHRLFLPDRLPRNLKHDAVSVYAQKRIELHAGDRIRWTDNDHARDMLNAGLARVEAIGERSIVVSSLVDGTVHDLGLRDRMLERLDLAYALNVHAAQGVTTDHGIVMMSAAERRLASEKAFLVAVTRVADQATLVVDSGRDLERAVMRNPGEKTSAMDVGRAMPAPAARMSMQHRLARDPSLDLTALRVPVEPKGPDLPFPEKDISLEL